MIIIKKSTRKNKKYMIYNPKTMKYVHFGERGANHFKDVSPIRMYTNLNHNDPKRRRNYLLRHHGVSSKKEALLKEQKLKGTVYTPKYLSTLFLW